MHRPKIVNTALTMNMRFKSLYLNNWWEFFNGSGMWLEDLQLVISSSGQWGLGKNNGLIGLLMYGLVC